MNEYIFYTAEGHTIAPNEEVEVENCQVLGRAFGKDESEAKGNLQAENKWIVEAGFDPAEFIVKQLLTDEQREAIAEIVAYMWDDEKKHYEETFDIDLDEKGVNFNDSLSKEHIFCYVNRLKDMLVN